MTPRATKASRDSVKAKTQAKTDKIRYMNVTELVRHLTVLVTEVELTGQKLIITKRGKPAVTIKKFEDADVK